MRNLFASGLLATAIAAASPAGALVFNFTTAPGASLTSAQSAAFAAAGAAWSSRLVDDITLNIQIGFSALVPGAIGATTPSLFLGTRAEVAGALLTDAKGSDDLNALATFATRPTDEFLLTSAQVKALGLGGAAIDGTIQFSSDFAFSTERNADGTVALGTYDLIGVAAHEIGHLLGFLSSIDGTVQGAETVLDQYRFASAGVHAVTAGAPTYFSLNNGLTNLGGFSPGGAGNFQASHWAMGISDVFRPTYPTGLVQNIGERDLRAMDAIGYDRAPLPEPAGWMTLIAGFGAIGAMLRRKIADRPRRFI